MSRKKTIVYLLEYPLDLPGGAQMSTESLCRSLKNSDYVPVVICPSLLGKSPRDYPFRVVTYRMGENRLLNFIMRAMAFRKLILEIKPDIVHIQMPESLVTYGFSGIRSKSRGGPALIFTDRGMYYGYRAHTMFLMKQTLKKARLLLTTTETNRRLWLEGSNVRDVRKVFNTISDSFSVYDEEKRKSLKDARRGRLSLGFAGRICEEKNWPFAVRLVRMIHEAGVDFEVRLVLSVFEKGDDEKVKEIVEGITSVVGSQSLVFGQDYTQEMMQEYYYGVDVFIMTSRFESFGKAAVEAMSRKCAVIATDVGGLSEVIGRSENLYTEDRAQKAVDYIKRAAADSEFLASEQEYFYGRYRDSFSGDRCRAVHVRIYDEVSGGKG
jgi:glycosyltransferase involved in cell wall biosynthesis